MDESEHGGDGDHVDQTAGEPEGVLQQHRGAGGARLGRLGALGEVRGVVGLELDVHVRVDHREIGEGGHAGIQPAGGAAGSDRGERAEGGHRGRDHQRPDGGRDAFLDAVAGQQGNHRLGDRRECCSRTDPAKDLGGNQHVEGAAVHREGELRGLFQGGRDSPGHLPERQGFHRLVVLAPGVLELRWCGGRDGFLLHVLLLGHARSPSTSSL
ncbi:hypothetical protein ACE1OC_40510 [Streptomyces sp. DSM 116496]|uniref:hypothetical protein n=1 Tax=Streptomyces stoeckheimensis TaxID=3344656 RepID=UPI0038B278BC